MSVLLPLSCSVDSQKEEVESHADGKECEENVQGTVLFKESFDWVVVRLLLGEGSFRFPLRLLLVVMDFGEMRLNSTEANHLVAVVQGTGNKPASGKGIS